MLYLIGAAVETLWFFTFDVVLWGVIAVSKLIFELVVSLSALTWSVVSVLAPAALSLGQYILEVSLQCSYFLVKLLHSVMLYTTLLVANLVHGVSFLFKAFLQMNWSVVFRQVGDKCVYIGDSVISTSFLLYNIASSIVSGICSVIFYFTMVVYSVLCLIAAWSHYCMEKVIILMLLIIQLLFDGIMWSCYSLGRFLQHVASSMSATNTTMIDIFQDLSKSSITATTAMSRILALSLQYVLVIGFAFLACVLLVGCMYHILSIGYFIWQREDVVREVAAQRRRNMIPTAARNGGHQLARHGNGVLRRRLHAQQRRDNAAERRILQRRFNPADRQVQKKNDPPHTYTYVTDSGPTLHSLSSQQQHKPSHHHDHDSVNGKQPEVELQSRLHLLENQLMREKESKQCVVCLDLPRRVMIRPCNHYCVCEQCATMLRKCPVCTLAITRLEKVFES